MPTNASRRCPRVPGFHPSSFILHPSLQSLIPNPFGMFRFFAPSYHVHSVSELTPPRLAAMGLDALLVDADSTLKHYSSEECLPEAAAWLADLHAGASACA